MSKRAKAPVHESARSSFAPRRGKGAFEPRDFAVQRKETAVPDVGPEAGAGELLDAYFERRARVAAIQETEPGGNGPVVQRFVGAAGTNQAGGQIGEGRITLDDIFVQKHVADDEAQAIVKTQARVDSGEPEAMVNGHIPNSLAPAATWKTALNESDEVLPPDGQWYDEDSIDASEADAFDDTGRLAHADSVTVNGWEVQVQGGAGGALEAESGDIDKSVGGDWSVDSLDVTINVDHCGD